MAGKGSNGGISKKAINTYYGTSGNDVITSNAATVYGDGNASGPRSSFGNDVIYGGSAVQTIYGEGGNDWINGGGGANSDGSGGYISDTLNGGDGVDWLSFQANSVNGDAYANGVSVSLGGGAFSFLTAGSGGVFATGSVSNFENVWGSAGSDNITGSTGNNELKGGAGSDSLDGGAGDDTLVGGAGDDGLTGGQGNDVFVFESSLENNGVDTIYGFDVAGSGGIITVIVPVAYTDTLDLSSALSGAVGSGGDISQYVQIIAGSGGTDVYVDMDGAGSGASPEVWVHLVGVYAGDEVNVKVGAFDANLTVS